MPALSRQLLLVLPLLIFLASGGCGGSVLYLMGEGCHSDAECKGERICHERECLFPEQVLADGGVIRPDGGVDGGPDAGPDAGPVDGGTGEGLVGSACETSEQCQQGISPVCYSEEETFGTFIGGYCSTDCSGEGGCPEGAICGMIFGGAGACLKSCEGDDDCRDEYLCSEILGPRACIPAALAP